MDDYKDCPIGVKNTTDIENMKDKFALMLKNVEDKMDDIKGDVTNLSKNMDKRFEEVDKRFDQVDDKLENFDKTLPERIDERIQTFQGKMSGKAVAWIAGLVGAVITAVAIALFKNILGL